MRGRPPGTGRSLWRSATAAFSGVLIALGAVIVARTALAGASGVAVGYIVGAALVAVGILRLFILRRT